VVEHGSPIDSRDRAASHGATVHTIPWRVTFAPARNLSPGLGQRHWVLGARCRRAASAGGLGAVATDDWPSLKTCWLINCCASSRGAKQSPYSRGEAAVRAPSRHSAGARRTTRWWTTACLPCAPKEPMGHCRSAPQPALCHTSTGREAAVRWQQRPTALAPLPWSRSWRVAPRRSSRRAPSWLCGGRSAKGTTAIDAQAAAARRAGPLSERPT